MIFAAGCTQDQTLEGGSTPAETPDYDGKYAYMSFGISLSNNTSLTRSKTTGTDEDHGYSESSDGVEFGSIEEHDVRTAIIMIANINDGSYISHAEVTGIITGSGNESVGGKDTDNFAFSTIGKFKYSQIAALYNEDGKLKDEYAQDGVYVCVFCNPTGELLNRFAAGDFGENGRAWLDWTGTVEEEPTLPGYTPVITNSIWAPRSFLMTNAQPAFADLPKTIEAWDNYDQEHPYQMSDKNENGDPDNSEDYGATLGKTRGPIYVERAVARIDLKADYDHLKGLELVDDSDPWRYPILGGLSSSMHDGTTDTGGGEANSGTSYNFVDVKMTRLSLVNMSKDFYFIRRVSATGMPDGIRYNRPETTTNYVVDTDAETKQLEDGYRVDNASEGFNFPLFTTADKADNPAFSAEYAYNRQNWYSANIADVMSNGKYDNWNNGGSSPNDRYNIWRYVTENTIPQDISGGTSRQVAIQSTGVVFKALIMPGNDIDKTFEYHDSYASAATEAAASDEIRYIPEEVVNALIASRFHLPRQGSGDNESSLPLWTPEGSTKAEKEAKLDIATAKSTYSYNYPTLYMFQGSMYAGFKTVVEAAEQYDGIGGLMYSAVNRVLTRWWCNLDELADGGTATFVEKDDNFDPNETEGHWLNLNVEFYNKIVNGHEHGEPITPEVPIEDTPKRFKVDINERDSDFRNLLTHYSEANNFTLYDASYEEEDRGGEGWGYYCYYFWWLKHNDNGIDGRMGNMEFATVRNNVYKLSVKKVSRLGHSLNTGNDPDPIIPSTPDEEDKVYIEVDIKIVPWVVRKNEIEF